MARNTTDSVFGNLLRGWRGRRGLSQLDLSLKAEVSSRHLSFLETGRSFPSRDMALHLGAVLELTLRDRNRLLEAAGFAAAFGDTDLGHPALSHIRRVLELLLTRFEPYPAFTVDALYNVVFQNRGAAGLMVLLSIPPETLAPEPNLVRMMCDTAGLRDIVVNWGEVARVMRTRLEATPGESAAALIAELNAQLDDDHPTANPEPFEFVLPIHIKRGHVELRFFSVFAKISSPLDVTLQELQIEVFMPADDATERAYLELTSGPAT